VYFTSNVSAVFVAGCGGSGDIIIILFFFYVQQT
jgi:hypothetical protein